MPLQHRTLQTNLLRLLARFIFSCFSFGNPQAEICVQNRAFQAVIIVVFQNLP